MRNRHAAVFVLFAALAAAGHARAEPGASAWEKHEFAQARLVSATGAVGTLPELRLGLEFKLNPGWKTYWRSPGEAGLPAQIDWSQSENLAEATVAWPVPKRQVLLGIETMGYEGDLVLPVVAKPKVAGEPVKLRATVDYLVCEKICVPAHAELALDLPAGEATPTAQVGLIDQWRNKVPGDGRVSGLTVERAALVRAPEGATLAVRVAAREKLQQPDVLIEGPAGLLFARPTVQMIDAGRGAILASRVLAGKASPDALLNGEVTFTAIDGARATEAVLKPVAGDAGDLGQGGDLATLGFMLLVALAGGLILNLMPCVLPVLSLKLMSVVGHGGGDAREVRIGFLASAAGILASFLLLALGALALRQAGMAVGWGIQFQQPVFIAGMAAILVLFACNMMGWFEFSGPRWAFDAAETRAASHGVTGHFLTGALATLLATPCSAPFLGTAIGFALSRGALEIVAVFLALGVGLASPYLLIAAFPRLATRMPRPGRWMLHLRRVLGVALALTALWLLGVLATQQGPLTAGAVASILATLALGFAFADRLPAPLRRVAPAAVALLVIATVGVAAVLPRGGAGDGISAKDDYWIVFDEQAIPARVARGEIIFVDVTADWCITCKANKALVLSRGEVARKLGGGAIVAMRADWTRPDPAISRYLARFGRYGIPFNVVYGPGAPQGVALPELLTSDTVLAALDQAGAGAAKAVATKP